jgi:hypothetical protein
VKEKEIEVSREETIESCFKINSWRGVLIRAIIYEWLLKTYYFWKFIVINYIKK